MWPLTWIGRNGHFPIRPGMAEDSPLRYRTPLVCLEIGASRAVAHPTRGCRNAGFQPAAVARRACEHAVCVIASNRQHTLPNTARLHFPRLGNVSPRRTKPGKRTWRGHLGASSRSSRIPHPETRITYPASRIPIPASRIPKLASGWLQPVPGAPQSHVACRFCGVSRHGASAPWPPPPRRDAGMDRGRGRLPHRCHGPEGPCRDTPQKRHATDTCLLLGQAPDRIASTSPSPTAPRTAPPAPASPPETPSPNDHPAFSYDIGGKNIHTNKLILPPCISFRFPCSTITPPSTAQPKETSRKSLPASPEPATIGTS